MFFFDFFLTLKFLFYTLTWTGWTLVFCGFIGLINSMTNIILGLLSLELMILGLIFLLLTYGLLVPNFLAFIFIFIFLILAGVESAIGLALLIKLYRITGILSFDKLRYLKG